MINEAIVIRPTLFYRLLQITLVPSLLLFVALTADVILHPLAPEAFYGLVSYRLISGLVIAPLTIGVGLLLMRRVPGNVIGLVMVLWGMGIAVWSIRADADASFRAALNYVYGSFAWTAILLMPIYFPDGQPYPPRVRAVVNAFACLFLVGVITAYLGVDTLRVPSTAVATPVYASNPLFISAMAAVFAIYNSVIGVAQIFALPTAVVSLYLRSKRSGVRERQQIKWLLWGIFTILALAPVSLLVGNINGLLYKTVFGQAVNLVLLSIYYLMPITTIGVAILRHRLYDIDIIIRRTLIYSVLTAVLALIYFGGVVLAQAALRPVIGENTDAGIVVSTLVIAALFTPLRRRIQNIIDRRFYRRKYDAERTLAAFNATMRDEVDLDKLQVALVKVVEETMQPKVVGLWVRNNVALRVSENNSHERE